MKCSAEMIQAAADERLEDDRLHALRKHLADCQRCRTNLDQATASQQWWSDVSRFLDESVLSDPEADHADSSTSDARLFDDDDPVGELRAIGAIDPTSHPEMLGMLGRYTVEREIGSGGMGVVLKAHDAELSRTVAIKVLAPHLARSGAAKQRFIREGRAAAAVVHDNVVAIHEVDTSGKLPSLVMRFVDGISLQRHVDLYGPLSVHDALRIGTQTAAGLAAAHRQGIIHRDVKPANILVNHSCNRAWISDFGLARAVDDASLTRTGFIAGTPHYMSPEQARGSDVGPASDLFSLGAVLYFMFAARPPWRAERSLAVLHRIVQHEHRPLWQINADIPRQLSDLVDRLLQKRVADRPQSATEVQQQLETMLSQLQNPGTQIAVDSANITVKQKWWNSPWIVAPIAAGLTALAFLMHDIYKPSVPLANTLDRPNSFDIPAEAPGVNLEGDDAYKAAPASAGRVDASPNAQRIAELSRPFAQDALPSTEPRRMSSVAAETNPQAASPGVFFGPSNQTELNEPAARSKSSPLPLPSFSTGPSFEAPGNLVQPSTTNPSSSIKMGPATSNGFDMPSGDWSSSKRVIDRNVIGQIAVPDSSDAIAPLNEIGPLNTISTATWTELSELERMLLEAETRFTNNASNSGFGAYLVQ